MTISNRRFVRLPPDGTGKRVGSKVVLYLQYNNATQEFFKGATVTGGTSSVAASILDVIEFSSTTGQLVLLLSEQFFNSVFVVGESLLVDSQVYAQATNTGDEVYYNEVVLVSGDNPTHRQLINEFGAQLTTFTDGSPRLDSFGRIKVSQPSTVGNYTLLYSSSLDRFSISTGVGGELTYLPSESSATLSVNSSSGSFVRVTSDKYHDYIPGCGLSVFQTAVVGDTGKANNIRRWGYYDDFNGLFWELSGSVLYAVIRSNVTGIVEETKVPQSQWSVDRVDGSEDALKNTSRVELDITKNNIYSLSFQWLGAGYANFSIYSPLGEKITVHTFENANTLSFPWMAMPNLPIRYENINISTTASTSELKMVCATVQTDLSDIKTNLPRQSFGLTGPTKIVSSSSQYTHYFAGRAGKYLGGKINRINSAISSVKTFSTSPMVLEVVKNATLPSASFNTIYPNTAAEFDTVATGNTDGVVIFSTIINGTEQLDIKPFFEGNDSVNINTKADISLESDTISVRARLLSGSTPAELTVAANWLEYR